MQIRKEMALPAKIAGSDFRRELYLTLRITRFFAPWISIFLDLDIEKTWKTKMLKCKCAKQWHGGGLCAQRTGYIYIHITSESITKNYTDMEKKLNRYCITIGKKSVRNIGRIFV